MRTKLFVPRPSSSLLPLPRLLKKLEAGLCAVDGTFSRMLALLSAPAGFGKTILRAPVPEETLQEGNVALGILLEKQLVAAVCCRTD